MAEWRGLGVRLEDDIVVTKKGASLLTENLPRSADEVEKYMKPIGDGIIYLFILLYVVQVVRFVLDKEGRS